MAFAVTTQPQSQESSSSHSQDIDCKGPWPNYSYPSKWEISDDFMNVHCIPKSADKATWRSQCTFWNEAIAMYAEQLLYKCPLKYNRLSFTPSDIERVYRRNNRMVPMCIIDIIKWMKHRQKSVILASYLEDTQQHHTTHNHAHHNDDGNNSANNSLLSSMMNSMIGYFMSNANSDDENDDELELECDNDDSIKAHTKVLFTPIVDELCEQMCHLNFYHARGSARSISSDLSELMQIGIIDVGTEGDAMDVFIINGFVFDRFCIECVSLTPHDVEMLKKYLMHRSKIRVFYLDNDGGACVTFAHEIAEDNIKNEMLCFNVSGDGDAINEECVSKMQLLSINLTMKHLKLQKTENEDNLKDLNATLLNKLKSAKTQQERKAFLQKNVVLLKRKAALKDRISSLDGSIYNLESTLHSMEDVKINKMVFDEMKNADKMLKYILNNGPSVAQVHGMKETIKESMQMNEEMGHILSKAMDTDQDADDDELLFKEYHALEEQMHLMQAQNIEVSLPNAPNHDIIIKDLNLDNNENDNKQVLLQ